MDFKTETTVTPSMVPKVIEFRVGDVNAFVDLQKGERWSSQPSVVRMTKDDDGQIVVSFGNQKFGAGSLTVANIDPVTGVISTGADRVVEVYEEEYPERLVVYIRDPHMGHAVIGSGLGSIVGGL